MYSRQFRIVFFPAICFAVFMVTAGNLHAQPSAPRPYFIRQADVAIYSLAFAPDGKTLATGGGAVVRFWDTVTGKELPGIEASLDVIYSLAYSPNGRQLAVGGWGGAVRVCDISKRIVCTTLRGHASSVYVVAFSPDGNTLVSGSHDGTARFWEVGTGRCLRVLKAHSQPVSCAAFSPDGTLLTLGSDDKTVTVWDVPSGKKITTLRGHDGIISCLAFAPNGKTVITGSNDCSVRLWAAATGRQRAVLRVRAGLVYCLAVSSDSKILAVGCGSPSELLEPPGRVELWALATSECTTSFRAHSRWVTSIAFSPRGGILATSGYNGAFTLWTLKPR
jgi:WD40 repeat protein